ERDPELVAEADELNGHRVRLEVSDPSEQALPELAQRQVGRVDDDVCLGSNRVEEPPLQRDRGLRAPTVRERVAVARLGEAADQRLVARLQEEHLRADAAALEGAA